MTNEARHEYTVSLTPPEAERAELALAMEGIDFKANLAVTSSSMASCNETRLTGGQAQEVAALMNAELAEHGLQGEIPVLHEYTHRQAMQLLELAHGSFQWEQDKIWDMPGPDNDQEAWDRTRGGMPELFATAN